MGKKAYELSNHDITAPTFQMPSTKIDTPTLFSTISGSSTALPGEALSLFRAYVRANYDDNDSGDGGLKGDAERDLDFVLATGDLDAMDEKGFKVQSSKKKV